jgi:hypothetical protein
MIKGWRLNPAIVERRERLAQERLMRRVAAFNAKMELRSVRQDECVVYASHDDNEAGEWPATAQAH